MAFKKSSALLILMWVCPICPWPNQGILSITVPLTSCLAGLDYFVLQIKTKIVIQLIPNQSNRRSMVQWCFPLLVFPGWTLSWTGEGDSFSLSMVGLRPWNSQIRSYRWHSNLVTPKSAANLEHLSNKLATKASSLNKSSCYAVALGMAKFIAIIATNWDTICCAA